MNGRQGAVPRTLLSMMAQICSWSSQSVMFLFDVRRSLPIGYPCPTALCVYDCDHCLSCCFCWTVCSLAQNSSIILTFRLSILISHLSKSFTVDSTVANPSNEMLTNLCNEWHSLSQLDARKPLMKILKRGLSIMGCCDRHNLNI